MHAGMGEAVPQAPSETISYSAPEHLMPPHTDLADLSLFLSAASAGSLSQVAWLNGMTPSAMSKRIRALEAAMGHRLFIRNGRGVALTEAGRALLLPARDLLEDASRLRSLVEVSGASPQGTVRLGMQASVSWHLIQLLWRRAREEAPGIRLQVHEASTRQLLEELLQGRIDVAVLSEWGPERLDSAVLVQEAPLLLVGPAGDPLSAGSSLPFRQLAGLPLILSPMPNGSRVWLETAARDASLNLNVVIEGHSMHLILKMVQARWGYTVAHRHAIQDELGDGQLSACPIVEPALVQKFYVACANGRPPTAATQRVAQWITSWRHASVDEAPGQGPMFRSTS